MTASGGRSAGCASASSAVVGRRRPRSPRRAGSSAARAGSAARRRRRGRAVRSRRHLGRAARRAGARATNVAPCPGARLGPDAAAVRLGEAARDREPEPGARRAAVARARWNGSKIRSQLALGDARARGRRRARSPPCRVAVTRTLHRLVGRRELERVLEQVRRARAGSASASTRTGGSSRARATTSTRSRAAELVERLRRRARRPSRARARRRRARLQPREVEQVLDEPVEPPCLDANRLERAPRGRRRRARARSAREPVRSAARIAVSGERRSCQTACSTAVLTVSLRRSASASSASRASRSRSTRNREQRGERGQEPASLGEARRLAFGDVQRADQAPSTSSGCGASPAGGACRAELDSRPADAEHLCGATRDRLELVLAGPDRASRSAGDVGEQRRLALALLGVGRAPTDARRELADRRPPSTT